MSKSKKKLKKLQKKYDELVSRFDFNNDLCAHYEINENEKFKLFKTKAFKDIQDLIVKNQPMPKTN